MSSPGAPRAESWLGAAPRGARLRRPGAPRRARPRGRGGCAPPTRSHAPGAWRETSISSYLYITFYIQLDIITDNDIFTLNISLMIYLFMISLSFLFHLHVPAVAFTHTLPSGVGEDASATHRVLHQVTALQELSHLPNGPRRASEGLATPPFFSSREASQALSEPEKKIRKT